MNVQLVMLALACVLSLHHILSQNLSNGLDMLVRIVGLL